MSSSLKTFQRWFGSNALLIQGAAAPLLVVAILSMMVMPMPSWMLDTFFTINIAVSLMVMMVAAYMIRPLDFAAFPAVLLLTTLMRLSLNVASTRVVLLEGHTGPGAAGAVIEAFGHFLIGGNFAVGLIVFSILVVINFVVVTKGAERIAEVDVGHRPLGSELEGACIARETEIHAVAGAVHDREVQMRLRAIGNRIARRRPEREIVAVVTAVAKRHTSNWSPKWLAIVCRSRMRQAAHPSTAARHLPPRIRQMKQAADHHGQIPYWRIMRNSAWGCTTRRNNCVNGHWN